MASRRKRIGVLIGIAVADHIKNILDGIYQAADEIGVDIVVFPGTQMEYCFQDGSVIDRDVYFSEMLIREHIRDYDVDGMIICFGSHTRYMNEDERKYLLDIYKDIPYVLLEEFTDKDNTGYIINDNYSGMRKIMEHLVEYHGYRSFLYISGFADNRESIERERAFRDVLAENDIPFDDKQLTYGSFIERCEKKVEELIDDNGLPEAIVCANDLMAFGVYNVCKKRGIAIGNPRSGPNTVAVTGYDDVSKAASMDPPLTSILQDFYAAGHMALEQILSLLRDGVGDGLVVPVTIQKRGSCGCAYGANQRYMPMSDAERAHPEFYAIKIAEIMKEEILLSHVGEDIGNHIYDMLYESIYKDVMALNGITNDTINAEVVVEQLRKIVASQYGQFISPHAFINTFADYLLTLIHSNKEPSIVVTLSDIMSEGMKYLQAITFNWINDKSLQRDIEGWQLALIPRDMNFVKDDFEKMFRVALDKIDYADKSDIFIFLYNEPVKYEKGIKWEFPETYLVAYKTQKDGIITYPWDGKILLEADEVAFKHASKYENVRSNRYCVADIYYKDVLYGYAISRMHREDVMYLSQSTAQMGLALSYLFRDDVKEI